MLSTRNLGVLFVWALNFYYIKLVFCIFRICHIMPQFQFIYKTWHYHVGYEMGKNLTSRTFFPWKNPDPENPGKIRVLNLRWIFLLWWGSPFCAPPPHAPCSRLCVHTYLRKLRWDTDDENISSFPWEWAYALYYLKSNNF